MSSPIPAVGSRAQVFHGNAKHTSGGLEKVDLLKNKYGRIVSKKKSIEAKKEKRLEKAGFKPTKGKFVLMRSSMKKSSSKKSSSKKSSSKKSPKRSSSKKSPKKRSSKK